MAQETLDVWRPPDDHSALSGYLVRRGATIALENKPLDAVTAALESQRALARQDWPDGVSVRVRVDCSYTPMIAWHDPGVELLAQLAVYGCTGGDFLIGAKASGVMTACSFGRMVASRAA